jgi:DNA mismatch repair protein MutL
VFVNGRAVENGILNAGLREGYHTALMRGQYPITYLFLDMDPAAVDVNVHPAKREVRFRDPNSVREAIVDSVRRTLESERGSWQQQFQAPQPSGGTTSVSSQISGAKGPTASQEFAGLDTAFTLRGQRSVELRAPMLAPASTDQIVSHQPSAVIPSENASPARTEGPRGIPTITQTDREAEQQSEPRDTFPPSKNFQIIGVLNKLYVLMENADGLVLVDQHAAHERILFEELRRRMEEQGVPSQRLLIPQTFDLPPRDAEWIERNLAVLQKMGIGIEGFGPNTFKIDSIPGFLKATDAVPFMQSVIDELKSASNSSSPLRLGEDMIAKTVCRHAVKANDPLRYLELEKLIQDLLECDLPYCCPHGRPTMIQISLAELEKKFGRKA